MFAHLEAYGMEKYLPPEFCTKFPDSITIKQSIATWKAIVVYQQKHECEISE